MAKFCPYCGHPVEEGSVCNCRRQAQQTQPQAEHDTRQTEAPTPPQDDVTKAPPGASVPPYGAAQTPPPPPTGGTPPFGGTGSMPPPPAAGFQPPPYYTPGGTQNNMNPHKRAPKQAKREKRSRDFPKADVLFRMVGKPADLLAASKSQDNFLFGIMFFLIKAVALGMVFAVMTGGLYGSVLNLSFGLLMSVFIQVFVVSFLVDLLLCCALFGIGRLMGGSTGFKSIIAVIGMTTIPLSLGFLLGGIVSFFSIRFAIVVLCVAFCCFAGLGYYGLETVLDVERNKKIFAVSILFALALFILWVCGDIIAENFLHWTALLFQQMPYR